MSNFEKKARKSKRQTRLTFDPVDRSSSPGAAKMSPARVRYGLPGGGAQTPVSSNGAGYLEHAGVKKSNSESKILPTPAKSSQAIQLDSESDDDHIITSSTRSRSLFKASKNPAQRKIDFNFSNRVGNLEGGDSTRRTAPQSSEIVDLSSDSSSEDELRLPLPRSSRKPIVRIPSNSDSEDEEPITSPPKRQRRTQIENEADNAVSSPLKRRRRINVELADSNNDDDGSDIVASPAKRRRNQAEQVDSEDENTRYTRQSKTRRHRTEKEKTLELLKRKRAGENIDALTESESESDDDSDPELQELSEFDDESEQEAQPIVAKKRRSVIKNTNTEDADDSDFLDDDEDDNLGVPLMNMIPLEFTSASHKPLKEHFKDATEWMVHKKINPGFNRDDPVYVHAFKKLDDEYGGYAKSKFISSQWTAEFTRAIYARPYLEIRDLAPGEGVNLAGEPICEVCNHRKHVSTFELQFKGKAYHIDTLEEVEIDDEDEDNDNSDSDHKSYNADGQELPNQEKKWKSGRFCKANAEQAHTLLHWKFALYEWVVGQLEIEGYLTPEKLSEREKMKSKQRREYANNVVDKWEADRQIRELYRDFKNQLEGAREAKQFSGGARWGRK